MARAVPSSKAVRHAVSRDDLSSAPVSPLLDIRHLRCIVAVATHLHFSRAADALDIAPPSLTRTIQEAETLLGARLFYRTKRSVELTAAGIAYVEQAQVALAHLMRAQEAASAAERGELGHIDIGYVASAAYAGVLQRTIGAFRSLFPRVEISFREILMDRVGMMLEEEQIDLAYFRPPMNLHESLTSVPIESDTFVIAIHKDSPLSAFEALNPAQLRNESFVLPEQSFGAYEVGRRGRFVPSVIDSGGTLISVLARVSLGGGVAVVPNALAQCVSLPGVTFRNVVGKPIATQIALASRKHDRRPAVRAFLAHLQSGPATPT